VLYRVEAEEGIAVVSMNRPKYRNAISVRMAWALDAAFSAAEEDPRVKVIVLRGEGENFSSGHDLGTKEQIADVQARNYPIGPAGHYTYWSQNDLELCLKWRNMSKPLVGGLKGLCIYHAWAVAATCDILLAAEDAKIMPGAPSQYSSMPWDVALNTRKAKELIFTQRFILAEEAEELGMVNRVVPTASLDEELMKMARVIAKADPFHLRMMKLTVNQAQDAAGFTTSIRSGMSAFMATRWDGNAKAGFATGLLAKAQNWQQKEPKAAASGAPPSKPVMAPMDAANSPEIMYYSTTAATKNAANRRSRL